jgi:hypothetical protein
MKIFDEDEPVDFDAAVYFGLDELEGKAYRILTCWLDRSRKMFPKYAKARMKKGDPRKSTLFKYAYKLARETQGILDEEDYDLYVRAQLEILRIIGKHQENSPVVDINCLCGEKAWKRWKLWKSKYENKKKIIEGDAPIAPKEKVCFCLERTKEWLIRTFSGLPTYEEFQEAITNKNLFRWINQGRVSPYYLAVSPYIARAFPEGLKKEAVDLDIEIYRSSITPEVRAFFDELFPNELAV